MSRPHFNPNDRFFVVPSRNQLMGNGVKCDPDNTVVRSGCSKRFAATPELMTRLTKGLIDAG